MQRDNHSILSFFLKKPAQPNSNDEERSTIHCSSASTSPTLPPVKSDFTEHDTGSKGVSREESEARKCHIAQARTKAALEAKKVLGGLFSALRRNDSYTSFQAPRFLFGEKCPKCLAWVSKKSITGGCQDSSGSIGASCSNCGSSFSPTIEVIFPVPGEEDHKERVRFFMNKAALETEAKEQFQKGGKHSFAPATLAQQRYKCFLLNKIFR